MVVPFIDGNWVDICSLSVAVIYGVVRTFRARKAGNRVALISRATGLSIANGIGIFPLALLAASTFSSEVLTAVLASNKVILSVAGVVALFAIFEDF